MQQTQSLKIFVDAHVFDQEYQGSRTFIKELYTALCRKENVELFLAACDIQNLRKNFPTLPNVHFLQYKTSSRWSRMLFNVRSILKQQPVDFAHFQYMIPPLKNKNCRYIVTIHDVIFEEYPEDFPLSYRLSKKLLYGMAAGKADLITTVSAFSKKSIEKFLDVPPGKIAVIGNGVDKNFFAPYEKATAKTFVKEKWGFEKYLLYVSRFEPRKNHIALLKAWLDLKLYDDGYFLVFAGHSSLPVPGLDEILQSLPVDIKRLVIMLRHLADDELVELYRAASLFVYPSKAEGFGIPPLEAAALKIPVICSNSSAMQEFTFFGENHIDTNDAALLKTKITAALSAKTDHEELQAIADHVMASYSWDRSAEDFYRLLKQHKTLTSTSKQQANDQLPVSGIQ